MFIHTLCHSMSFYAPSCSAFHSCSNMFPTRYPHVPTCCFPGVFHRIKNRYPNWNPGKWKCRLTSAVPWWFNFDPDPFSSGPPGSHPVASVAFLALQLGAALSQRQLQLASRRIPAIERPIMGPDAWFQGPQNQKDELRCSQDFVIWSLLGVQGLYSSGFGLLGLGQVPCSTSKGLAWTSCHGGTAICQETLGGYPQSRPKPTWFLGNQPGLESSPPQTKHFAHNYRSFSRKAESNGNPNLWDIQVKWNCGRAQRPWTFG